MLDFEKQYYSKDINYIAGADEAGRGPIAGPVVCAAVIFPKDYVNEDINDSKQLSEKKREELYKIILEHALAYNVQIISPETIDEINILEASRLGMTLAIQNLNHKVDLIITDYMKLRGFDVEVIDLVKGDAKAMCVAAASILAKVTRDRIMNDLDKDYPNYHFGKTKGYPTKESIDALEKYGPIKGIHRFSYKPVLKTLEIKLF